MSTVAWVILVIVIIAVAVAAFMAIQARRSKRLRSRFGPEYDHLVHERGSARKAEAELERRVDRVERFQLRRLNPEECDRFASEWRTAQERFVDDPRGAVAEADQLVQKAMKACGYPVGADFDARIADLSVDHPVVVETYRAGHVIAVRDFSTPVSTEDLRTAMKHYRTLFEDLLGRRVSEVEEVRR